jgi:osmotically-inducible protein OsmY
MTRRITCLCALSLFLMSCTPVGILVTGATTAGTFAMEERGFKGATHDLGLKAEILGAWTKNDISYATDLSVIVYNAKAMVMGTVETEDQRAKAIGLVWQVDGIKDVYNEIMLKKDTGIQGFTQDTWIGAKLTTAVTLDGQILASNYKVDVEAGVVYIIGIAQTQGELNRFINHAKAIEYVQKVVSHVEVKPQKSMFRPNYEVKEPPKAT